MRDSRFSAYRRGTDGALVEQTGLYFEEFEVGELFHHRPGKFTNEPEALEHARRSMDWNPRFTDPTFAKERFDDPTSPLTEIYTISTLTVSTTRTLGRVVASLAWRNVSLQRFVYPGESFRTQSLIQCKKDSRSRPDQGILTVSTTAFDSDDREVLSYDRVLLVYKHDCGPYAVAISLMYGGVFLTSRNSPIAQYTISRVLFVVGHYHNLPQPRINELRMLSSTLPKSATFVRFPVNDTIQKSSFWRF